MPLLRQDIHYDECLMERWRAKGGQGRKPTRESKHKVFQSVVNSHRCKPCLRLELPENVKNIFRKPSDEDAWDKLQDLHDELRFVMQGCRPLVLDSDEDVHELADAVERCEATKCWNELAADFTAFPPGGHRCTLCCQTTPTLRPTDATAWCTSSAKSSPANRSISSRGLSAPASRRH